MKKRSRLVVLIFVIFFIMECIFFRNIIFQGMYFGDYGDGKLTMLLAEHWWNVLRGTEGISELPIFYPTTGVLGYSDMLLEFGLIHSIFRAMGCNMYHAYIITLLLVHVTGTIALFVLLHNKFNLHWGWAMLGTVAFSYSNSYAQLLGHTQLMALSCVPVFLLFVVMAFQKFQAQQYKKTNLWILLSILQMLFILYTSWYVAFFVGLYVLLYVILYMIRGIIYRKIDFHEIIASVRKYGVSIAIWIVVVIISLLPFVKTYLPLLKSTGGYSWEETAMFLPEIADLINVGSGNLLETGLMEQLNLGDRGYVGELTIGFSIFFWILILGIALLYKFYILRNTMERQDLLISNLAIVGFCGILLVLRLSANGVSLWWLVAQIIPGAKSIRTACRWILFLSLPFSIYIAIAGNRLMNAKQIGKTKNYLSVAGVVALILLSYLFDMRNEGVYATVSVASGMDYMESVSEPPEECAVFYIKDSSGESDYSIFACCLAQMKAYEIANKYDIKTINGYSGQFPEGWGHWDGIYYIYGSDYENCVRQWCKDYGLVGVYCYDIGTNQWTLFE